MKNDFSFPLPQTASFCRAMAAWIAKADAKGRPDSQVHYEMYDFCHGEKKTCEEAAETLISALSESGGKGSAFKKTAALFTSIKSVVDLEFEIGIDMFDAAAATTENEENFYSSLAKIALNGRLLLISLKGKSSEGIFNVVEAMVRGFALLSNLKPAAAENAFLEAAGELESASRNIPEKNEDTDSPPESSADLSISHLVAAILKIKNQLLALSPEEFNDPMRKMSEDDLRGGLGGLIQCYELPPEPDLEVYRSRLERDMEAVNIFISRALSVYEKIDSGTVRSLLNVFKSTFKQLSSEIMDRLPPGKDEGPPDQPVIEINPEHYILPCSKCGTKDIYFERKKNDYNEKESLRYNGIVFGRYIDLDKAQPVYELLKTKDIEALHRLLENEYRFECGIDAYCPDCRKIYCRRCYQVQEFYDEGYYDYSNGTCPNDHVRMIDD